MCDEFPDGLPLHVRALCKEQSYELIDVPPGLMQRAAELAAIVDEEATDIRLGAVFQKYGVRYVDDARDEAVFYEKDIEKQLNAWCDYGESLRTETDLLHPEGSDLFHERQIDWILD